MTHKRSRQAFEADLQAQQSPYVIYGTPLPPLDPSTRDDGSYVPVWKQEVTDEQGRKRLHGAFTGGFSAGYVVMSTPSSDWPQLIVALRYFNTVGSKDGWTPSTFVSSRTDKKKNASAARQQRPEDFMDDEDLAEAEEARMLQTNRKFAGLGSTADELSRPDQLMGILRTSGETMGIKLLKKMGWREGQGVGPKLRRKARTDDGDNAPSEGSQETHLFAPENSKMIAFVRKDNRRGLGLDGEGRLGGDGVVKAPSDKMRHHEEDDVGIETIADHSRSKKSQPAPRSGLGVGILNDNGSDDEDPYNMGPKISYNRVVGRDKKKKKLETIKSAANPLLNNKPVFISKKAATSKRSSTFRRCHDGRLPLDGFVLSSSEDPLVSIFSNDGKYPAPEIPKGWKSSKKPLSASLSAATPYRSAADVAKASTLSPRSRATLLGEAPLPGKSIFDYLNPAARSRIALITNNQNLPPALGEATSPHPPQSRLQAKSLHSLVPPLSAESALAALQRGTTGWMPYAEDPAKRARYQLFLEISASLRPPGTLPDRAPDTSNDDWVKEMQEFAHAAQIFKPMTGMMASRFTSSSSSSSAHVLDRGPKSATVDKEELLTRPSEKPKDPAAEAARLGMFGRLTRHTQPFYPTRLLCKRFNVQPPAHVQTDPGAEKAGPQTTDESKSGQEYSQAVPQKRLELLGKQDMDELMRESGFGKRRENDGLLDETREGAKELEAKEVENKVVNPERNDAIEKERPGEELFKAIFGSDSEDE
ncbi:MAG: hypothetical protein LQ351_002971 [Letrouitia transgressa]|nr:MAG: hypothetical protein LQ351_002971 [Letrouitia transgressa]